MKVIICGAGRVGHGIASQLSAENNEVTVIDLSPKLVQQISTDLDVRGVVGHGSHPDVLVRAGVQDADMIIAATQLDEVNMVACQVAHSLFNVSVKIARVRAQAYLNKAWQDLFANKNMPIDVIISPEIEVARTILQRITTPGAFMTVPFAGGKIKLLGVRILDDCPVSNTALSQLTELFPDLHAMIVGIKREGRIFVPKGTDQVLVGDEVYVVSHIDRVARTLDILGRKEERGRKLILIGAGNIGVHVARQLEAVPGIRVRAIEVDDQQARRASIALKRTVVLHGDGLNHDVLVEAGVEEADIALALSNNDRVNILAGGYAKEAGVRRAFCLVNDRTLDRLQQPLGIDVYIDPLETTISTILQHVRRGRIISVQTIEDGEAEVIEAVALAASGLVGRPLRDVDIGDGIRVAAVQRDNQLLFPDGDFVIKAGDHVVLFAEREAVPNVEKMFRVSHDYV